MQPCRSNSTGMILVDVRYLRFEPPEIVVMFDADDGGVPDARGQ
jgi:hypothetical protein